jgi:hypothetical protein
MPGLFPGIHVLLIGGSEDVDGLDKPGHDGDCIINPPSHIPSR